jgi:protein FAM32A
MSSYEFAGGGLKLKGVSDKIKKKKKSKKDKRSKDLDSIMPKRSGSPDLKRSISNESESDIVSNIIEKLPNDSTIIIKKPIKTKAELAYEKVIEKRQEQKILAKAELSHKERVEIYNKNLDQLSEYNDIPKVSWTK